MAQKMLKEMLGGGAGASQQQKLQRPQQPPLNEFQNFKVGDTNGEEFI